jgi:hypothetical protein
VADPGRRRGRGWASRPASSYRPVMSLMTLFVVIVPLGPMW